MPRVEAVRLRRPPLQLLDLVGASCRRGAKQAQRALEVRDVVRSSTQTRASLFDTAEAFLAANRDRMVVPVPQYASDLEASARIAIDTGHRRFAKALAAVIHDRTSGFRTVLTTELTRAQHRERDGERIDSRLEEHAGFAVRTGPDMHQARRTA